MNACRCIEQGCEVANLPECPFSRRPVERCWKCDEPTGKAGENSFHDAAGIRRTPWGPTPARRPEEHTTPTARPAPVTAPAEPTKEQR